MSETSTREDPASDQHGCVASLQFYDYPETASALDGWWMGLARQYRDLGIPDVPDHLIRGGLDKDAAARTGRLLFGQTCGYPLIYELKSDVQLVATPHYSTPYTEGPLYRSLIVARASDGHDSLDDLRGARVAVNGLNSFSGYIALQAAFKEHVGDEPFFSKVVLTGDHLKSLKAIASNMADTCACDCVSYELIQQLYPELAAKFSVIGLGPLAPGLPYVTAATHDADIVDRLQTGLFRALEDPGIADVRKKLLIADASPLALKDYQAIVDLVDELKSRDTQSLFPDKQTDKRGTFG